MPDEEFACTVCNRQFEKKYYDKEQKKCILHCEKDDWFEIDSENQKKWKIKKVNNFWQFIQNELDNTYQYYIYTNRQEPLHYDNVIFPTFQSEQEYDEHEFHHNYLGTNFYSYDTFEYPNANEPPYPEVNTIINKCDLYFRECTFLDSANLQKYHFERTLFFGNCNFTEPIYMPSQNDCKITFYECDFYSKSLSFQLSTFQEDFLLQSCKRINLLSFHRSVFHNKFRLRECVITNNTSFFNTKFKGLADFYKTTFEQVDFVKTDFEDIVVFSETTFKEDIDFKYTKFLELAIFRDSTFEKTINLRDTIFKSTTNFLNIEARMKNRETARIIKNSFEDQKNIIEANRFYSLEMKEREKELRLLNHPLDWIVFKLHGMTSGHSQNWFLSLFWIIIVTSIFILFTSENHKVYSDYYVNAVSACVLFLMLIIGIFLDDLKHHHRMFLVLPLGALIFTISFISFQDISLSTYINAINPFSLAKSSEELTFGESIYKLFIAYLIYQFIIAVRQNTRRK